MITNTKHLLLPLTAIGLSCLFSLLVAEVGLRIFYDQLPYRLQEPIRHVGKYGASYPPLGPTWFETCVGDQQLSARNIPNLKHKKVQFGPAVYHISTDSLGFDKVAFRAPNHPAPWDGIVVGDSFTFCHHVEYEQCWVSEVERTTNLHLANLAVPATGSVSHSQYLEKYGRSLHPKIVIWQYWVNDTREDVEHIMQGFTPCPRGTDWIAAQYQNDGIRQLIKNGSVVANLAHNVWRSLRGKNNQVSSGVYHFETSSGRKLFAWKGEGPAPASTVEETGFNYTSSAISMGAERTQAAGGRFLLLLPPSNLQTYAHELPSDELRQEAAAENAMTDRIIAFAQQNDIDYLDLRQAFIEAAKQGADLYPDYDVHWTPAGNELAAEHIAQWIQENFSPPSQN